MLFFSLLTSTTVVVAEAFHEIHIGLFHAVFAVLLIEFESKLSSFGRNSDRIIHVDDKEFRTDLL